MTGPSHRPAVIVSAALVLGWVALAAWHPATTYHLAPALVAAAGSVMHRRGVDQPLTRPDATRVAVTGTALALVVTVALDTGGLLRGPTVLGTSAAGAESAVAAVAAGLGGWWFAVRPHRQAQHGPEQ